MVTKSVTLPSSLCKALRQLTHESRLDLAIPVALKDLLKLKIQKLDQQIAGFGKKYGMSFAEFKQACKDGRIKNPYSYEVEQDDFHWQAFLTDRKELEMMAQWLE